MRIKAVTTCSRKQWNEYGLGMAESFVQFWQDDAKLIVYGDEYFLTPIGVEWRKMPKWHDEFKRRHEHNKFAHGMHTGRYLYRFDCVKFSHKVAALTDIGLQESESILVWIDADTFTDQIITVEEIKRWLPVGHYMAWLDRKGTYPECGFMLFDTTARKLNMLFMKALLNTYESDAVFDIKETHDSYVIKHIVENLNIRPRNLSAPNARSSHPWVDSDIGKYMDHLKGARKATGKSSERKICNT